jgi:hypothetical protein
LRRAGAAAGVPSAILSRGLAGIASRTLIVNLPGSSGGVRDGMIVLRQILVHAVDQIRGGDHPRSDRPDGDESGSDQSGTDQQHAHSDNPHHDTPANVADNVDRSPEIA